MRNNKTKADIPPNRDIVVHPSPQQVIPSNQCFVAPSPQRDPRPSTVSASLDPVNLFKTSKPSRTMTTRSGRVVRPPEHLDL